MRRLPKDFKLRRRGFRGLMPSMTSGRTTHAMLESFSLASRAADALKPIIEKSRLALDFSSARHCRVDPETPGKLILLVRNSAQHAKLRNLSATLLAALSAKGLPFTSIEIRVRPLKTSPEAAPDVEKPRPRSISGAAALHLAAQRAKDPELAALLGRLASAVAPTASARPLVLQLELGEEIECIAAGLDRIQDLRVHIPKAPDPALIPSEEDARRNPSLASVRQRMLEKTARSRSFSMPLDLAEGALKGLSRASRALYRALYGENTESDSIDQSCTASASCVDKLVRGKPDEENAAALEADYVALRREAAKAFERIEETARALQMLADEKAAAARRALAQARREQEAAQAPAAKRDEKREALSERLSSARRQTARALAAAGRILDAIAELPALPDELTPTIDQRAEETEHTLQKTVDPSNKDADFSQLHNERRTLSAHHIHELAAQTQRFIDRAQMLLTEIAFARGRMPTSRSLERKPPEAAVAELDELAAAFAPLFRRAAELDAESEALEDRMAVIEAELSDIADEMKTAASTAEEPFEEMDGVEPLPPIEPIPADAMAALTAQLKASAAGSAPCDPLDELERLAAGPLPDLDAFLAKALAFLNDARRRAPAGPNPAIIPLAQETQGDPEAEALRSRLLARRDAADAAAAAIDQAQTACSRFERLAAESLAHGLTLASERFADVIASLRTVDAVLKHRTPSRPAEKNKEHVVDSLPLNESEHLLSSNSAAPKASPAMAAQSAPNGAADSPPTHAGRAAAVSLLLRRLAGPTDDDKESLRAALLARAREASGDAAGQADEPQSARQKETAAAPALAIAEQDKAESAAVLPPLPTLPPNAEPEAVEEEFRSLPTAVMSDALERLNRLRARLPAAPDPKLLASLADDSARKRPELSAVAERMKCRAERRRSLEAVIDEAKTLAESALKRLTEPLGNAERQTLCADMRRALALASALQKQLEKH